MLDLNFTIYDSKTGKIAQQPLITAALHPTGYYMAVALSDNIVIYHIMHSEFRVFHTHEIKNVKKLKFSNGGQLLCAADFKQIHVISTYGLETIGTMPCPSSHVANIAFNENDSVLSLVTSDGFH